MTQRFVNNFSTTVAATFGAADTFLQVASTEGLPTLAAGEYLLLTVFKKAGANESAHEVVKVTDIVANQLKVQRGFEGAAPAMFLTGDRVEARFTAAGAGNLVQRSELASHVAAADPHPQYAKDTHGHVISDVDGLQSALDAKQPTLVSGTNIKTINGESLLGSGGFELASSKMTANGKTSAYTVVAGDLGKIINCTSGAFTVSLTAAATLGAGFNCWIWNTSNTTSDAIMIDPNGSETIDGVATLILRRGEGLQIVCDGSNWQTGDKKAIRGYAENLVARAIASGDSSVAMGGASIASGSTSIALGYGAIASGQNSTALGPNGTTASSSNSTAIGSNSGGTKSQAVTGAGAMALGGSYASGTDSFAAAIANNTSSYGATGANSVAVGFQAKVTGAYGAVIGGQSNVVSQNYAVVLGGFMNSATQSSALVLGGDSSTASGQYAVVLGGKTNQASGNFSQASGFYAVAARYGKQAFASGRFAANGDAQSGKMVLRKQTTDATTTVLTADSGATSTTNQVILPDDSTYAFTILVVARRTDTNDESAGYKFEGVIDRHSGASTTAIVGTVAKTVLAEDTAAWDCNVTADTTNGGLKIEVTGEAGKTIRWVATAWTTEVT